MTEEQTDRQALQRSKPLFCIILDRWYVQFEETIMQQTFGADYTAYCARVRRWL
jgi:protein-S-isoprenylcysteine O-methyltransferase Ste14